MDLSEEIIDAATSDGEMAVLVKQPAEGGDRPTVVIFHDGPGIRTATHEFMRKLAGAGYRVITPDLYHRQGRLLGVEPEQMAADRDTYGPMMMGWLRSVTDEGIQQDFDDALAAVGVGEDTRVGVIGFCMGAKAVARAMVRLPHRIAAGAMWHPSFLADDTPNSPHLSAGDIASPLYIGIGEADQVQSIAMHQRFFDAIASVDHVELETFPGADHGYTWPGAPSYHQVASDTSWDKTISLFERTLR